MNRSILIVMFDFIVLSMLSMITGLSTLENPYGNDGTVVSVKTANVIAEKLKNEKSMLEEAYLDLKAAQDKFGYSQARSEAMQKIEAQLAATDLQLEILSKRDLADVDVKESQSLSPEAATLPSKYRSAMAKITGRTSSGAADGNILDVFEFGEPGSLNFGAVNETRRILGVTSVSEENEKEESVDSAELLRLQDSLRARELEVAALNRTLKAKDDQLRTLEGTTQTLQAEIVRKDGEIQSLTEAGVRKDRAIIAVKQELRVQQARVARKEREVGVRVQEVKSVQNVLGRAVSDLSRTKAEAANARRSAHEAQVQLVTVRRDLSQLRKRIEGNVLDYYDSTVRNIRIYVEQERFFANHRSVQNLYLPVIMVENRPVVISLFRLLSANNLQDEIELDNVLNYVCKSYAPDGSETVGYPVKNTLTIPRKDIRVGCLELENYKGKTLSFLTFSDMKRRGLQNLYLFKANSFGHDGGSLEGRCSLSMKANDEYLYIRNNHAGSEAVAEQGDLVMTKEGGFVGIIVGVNRFDETKSEAKCFVFPDDFRLRNSIHIRLNKSPDGKYLDDFDTIGAKLLPRLEQLEQSW